jgi:hypothetical protein
MRAAFAQLRALPTAAGEACLAFRMQLLPIFPRAVCAAVSAAFAVLATSPAGAQDPCQPVLMTANGPVINASCPSEPPPFRLLNIAGRAVVQREDRAVIGGFIIGGSLPVQVIVRAIGTSLKNGDSPLSGRLMNPLLELRGGSGELISENDDWRASPQSDQIRASGLAPREDKEGAIIATLEPGSYTAVLRGVDETEGIGVIEIYDLQSRADAELSNLASRAFVSSGDNVLIGGLIVHGGPPKRVLVRAIGSSLAETVPDALQDPTIELVNGEGAKVGENDNWRDSSNPAEIEATGAAPSHDKESAIVATLSAGPYTATVRGKNNGTGIGVVEIYRL